MMLEIKYKNQILATIDQLRQRKARPDISRICNYMWRSYKIPPKDTKSDLRKCIGSKAVYQVEYKGNISYRNAAKWRRTAVIAEQLSSGKRSEQPVLNKQTASTMPNVTQPVSSSPPASPNSSPQRSRPPSVMSDDAMSPKQTSSSSESSPIHTSHHSAGSIIDNSSEVVRVGSRPKRAKKVFDPSDVITPVKTKRRGRPVGSLNKSTLRKRAGITSSGSNSVETAQVVEEEPKTVTRGGLENGNAPGGVCSVCLQAGGRSSRLVECRDCSNKAHTRCLKTKGGVLRQHPDSSWQCPHCKTCTVCCETSDAGVLTVCMTCADAYHSLCHDPRIPERLQACDRWECSNCVNVADVKLVSKPAAVLPQRKSLYLRGYEVDRLKLNPQMKVKDDDIDPSIPDITNWTKDDVFNYFYGYFPDIAHIIKNQELDGHAILVARREDIVRGLGLALGPALKVYRHVVRLQSRRDNFSLCWG